jgi:hypothetical protein
MVLRLKPRNCHDDFEAQITKPQMLVLRSKPGNVTLDFEAKIGKSSPPVLRPNREKLSQWF